MKECHEVTCWIYWQELYCGSPAMMECGPISPVIVKGGVQKFEVNTEAACLASQINSWLPKDFCVRNIVIRVTDCPYEIFMPSEKYPERFIVASRPAFDGLIKAIARKRESAKGVVHTMRPWGRVLCGFHPSDNPRDWPAGHTCTDTLQRVTCDICRSKVAGITRELWSF